MAPLQARTFRPPAAEHTPAMPAPAGARLTIWRWRSVLLLFSIALAVRALTALVVRQPGYADAYYYYAVAEELASGHGLTEPFIWNWLNPPAAVVHPGNTYWMPLASLLSWPFFVLFGVGFRQAQIPLALLSALFPALTYLLALDLFRSRRLAWLTALLTITGGAYTLHWMTTDNFTAFGLPALGALWLAARALERPAGALAYLAVAGALTGLAHLARADGPLLYLAIALAVVSSCVGRPKGFRRSITGYLMPLAAGLGAYLVVMAPWFTRNLLTFGAPLPVEGSKALFWTEYNDFFAYGKSLTIDGYLSWGAGNIVLSKLSALGQNLQRVLEVLIFAQAPFALIGLIRLARRPAYRPFFLYVGLLWLVMSLGFTFPGPRGSFLHSLVAGLPFLMGAVVYGLDWLLLRLARWRRWQPATALPVFSSAFVVISLLATAYLAAIAAADWDTRFTFYRRVSTWLEVNTAPDDLVMFIDPAGLYYASGRPSIVATSNTMSETVDLLRRYRARYLILEEKRYALAWSDWAEGREIVPALELVGQGAGFRAYRLR